MNVTFQFSELLTETSLVERQNSGNEKEIHNNAFEFYSLTSILEHQIFVGFLVWKEKKNEQQISRIITSVLLSIGMIFVLH